MNFLIFSVRKTALCVFKNDIILSEHFILSDYGLTLHWACDIQTLIFLSYLLYEVLKDLIDGIIFESIC